MKDPDPAPALESVQAEAPPEQVNVEVEEEEDKNEVPEKPSETPKIKVVLVGDTSVGKTCLIQNYLHNQFSDEYEPTVLDVYKGIKNVKGT